MLGLNHVTSAVRGALDWAAPPPPGAAQSLLEKNPAGLQSAPETHDLPAHSPAIEILKRGLAIDDRDRVAHAWWKLYDPASDRTGHRVIVCDELRVLPIESRDDPDILGKAWGALRGLYRAEADAIYIASGQRQPDLVVSQLYASAGEAVGLDEAIDRAREGQKAVLGLMANYLHSRLAPPSAGLWHSIDDQMRNLPKLLYLTGYPDPRHAKKGLNRDGDFGAVDEELASQQGEHFLRGMAALNSEFLFCTTAKAIVRDVIIHTQNRLDQIASEYASRQKGSIGASFTAALPIGMAGAESLGAGLGAGEGTTESATDSTMESESTGVTETKGSGTTESMTTSRNETVGQSRTQGTAHGQTEGTGQTLSQAWGEGRTETQGTSETASDSRGLTESQSQSRSLGETRTEGDSRTRAQGTSETRGQSTTQSEGVTQTRGQSVAQGRTVGGSESQTESVSGSRGGSEQRSSSATSGWSRTESTGRSQAESESEGTGRTENTGMTSGISNNQSAGGSAKVAGTGISGSTGRGASDSASHALGTSETEGSSSTRTLSGSQSDGQSGGQSQTRGQGSSWSRGETVGQGRSTTWGGSTTQGESQSQGQSQTQSQGQSQTQARSLTDSLGHSRTQGESRTESVGEAEGRTQTQSQGRGASESQARTATRQQGTGQSWTRGRSQVQSEAVGQTHALGRGTAQGVATSQTESAGTSRTQSEGSGHAVSTGASRMMSASHMTGLTRGLHGGLVPGASLSRAWQTEDDVAIRLTNETRKVSNVLYGAVKDGGWMVSAWLLVEQGAAPAAKALASQAFHGPTVPRPVSAYELEGGELAEMRPLVMALRGDRRLVDDPNLVVWEGTELLWTRAATLLPSGMAAAYWAPSVFEQGGAITMQEKTPPMAFHTRMEGEAVLGHQVSPETDLQTEVALRLSRERHFHTAFCGDTGYGKTVAAERLVYETTRYWGLKTIVLDFGAGWRKFLNAPGMEGKVEIRQLSPGSVRPLRWNPLQIGRYIKPEQHWRALCDVLGQIGHLGAARQIHELRNTLATVYRDAGVFVDDPEVRRDGTWATVTRSEADALGLRTGTPLGDLSRDDRQRVAVLRSRAVGFKTLVSRIDSLVEPLRPSDIRRSMLEGIRERLSTFTEGSAAAQYAPGDDAVDITEIVPGESGVAILEGGAFLDQFSKAFLLAWASWQIYTDVVVQRSQRGRTEPAHIQIVFEEANKILGGSVSATNDEGGPSVAEQFEGMWRDSRKYGIWLHLLTQTPSAIPPGIMSSCNNLFVSQLKNARDRDLITAMLHRSEKSLTDEEFRKFISRIPKARAIVKLGYSDEAAELEPAYVRPWMLDVDEPSDWELEELWNEEPDGPDGTATVEALEEVYA